MLDKFILLWLNYDMELTDKITIKDRFFTYTITYDLLLNKLATHLYVTASKNTNDCTWEVTIDELVTEYLLDWEFFTEQVRWDICVRTFNLFSTIVSDIRVKHDSFVVNILPCFCVGYIWNDACLKRTND